MKASRRYLEELLRTLPDSCCYCGAETEGNFSIHRDGFGIGPDVPLCDACSTGRYPTCEQIWNRIARL